MTPNPVGPRSVVQLEAEPVAFLAQLVGIDSVNPGRVPDGAGESRVADVLRARLERPAFEFTIRDAFLAAATSITINDALGTDLR